MGPLRVDGQFDDLPSPIEGMSLRQWLGYARIRERKLSSFLSMGDLNDNQRKKIEGLLHRLRAEVKDLEARHDFKYDDPR